MTNIDPFGCDYAAATLPAASVTAVTWHTGSGKCTVAFKSREGPVTNLDFYGQQGADLYNAFVTLASIVPSITT
jgi:hypothetical protein